MAFFRRVAGHVQTSEFDRLVDTYAALSRLTRDRVGEWLEEHLPRNCETAIDIGCGPGRHLHLLAGIAKEVTALDPSSAMIARAKKTAWHANVVYWHGQLSDITAMYDVVVCVSVLHHLSSIRQGLLAVAGVVQPAGVAFVVEAVSDRRRNLFLLRLLSDGLRHFLCRLARRDLSGFALVRAELDPRWLLHRTRDRFPTVRQLRDAVRASFEQVEEFRVGGLAAFGCLRPHAAMKGGS